MKMKSLLRRHRADIALVIGNGINRYGAATRTNSWNDLLVELAKTYLPERLRQVPKGVSLTEFYDILELKTPNRKIAPSLQQQFCSLMASWQYYEHHSHIVEWAQQASAPILTTNFEDTFARAGHCTLHRTKKGGFTDFYPWETYYGTARLSNPIDGFGIWHVNGMQYYQRSIRLGLSHYIGSVERARSWLHKGNERRLFSGKNTDNWKGSSSWLHVMFNKPLLIFGLGLDETEVFFRWLLIERARYFRKFPDRAKSAWFVYAGDQNNDGKQFFLGGVGITCVHVSSYDEIYDPAIWN